MPHGEEDYKGTRIPEFTTYNNKIDRKGFGPMEAERGEACTNIHPPHTYTCPGCYKEHEVRGVEEGVDQFIRCECKAPLRLSIEMVPNYRATVADEDEEGEHLLTEASNTKNDA